jgi:hypothetical protein
LGASNIAPTAVMQSRFIHPVVHIQASTTAATARNSAGKCEKTLLTQNGHEDAEGRDMSNQQLIIWPGT